MTSNYLKIKGIGSIVLPDEKPEPNKDYLLSLVISLSSINKNLEDSENPYYTYICKYISTNELKEIGASNIIKVIKGKSPSQIQRFKINEYLLRSGKEVNEENYKIIMDKIGKMIDNWGND